MPDADAGSVVGRLSSLMDIATFWYSVDCMGIELIPELGVDILYSY